VGKHEWEVEVLWLLVEKATKDASRFCHGNCHNPTLAKCGGEAQHLEKVRMWSPPGLPNV